MFASTLHLIFTIWFALGGVFASEPCACEISGHDHERVAEDEPSAETPDEPEGCCAGMMGEVNAATDDTDSSPSDESDLPQDEDCPHCASHACSTAESDSLALGVAPSAPERVQLPSFRVVGVISFIAAVVQADVEPERLATLHPPPPILRDRQDTYARNQVLRR